LTDGIRLCSYIQYTQTNFTASIKAWQLINQTVVKVVRFVCAVMPSAV